jgi:hypothetical protein
MEERDWNGWHEVNEDERNKAFNVLKSSYPEELSNCNTMDEILELVSNLQKPANFEEQKTALTKEIARMKQLEASEKIKVFCALKKKLYYMNNTDKIQQLRKEHYLKNKERLKVERKKKLASMTPSELDAMRWKRQYYYLKNKDKLISNALDKRREIRNANKKDIVICKECNKEYLRGNLARHVKKIHPWIVNYKEGH